MFSLKKYQDIVSLIFYKHGLTCSTYPFVYILGVIVAFLILCYPLTKMPFPGNAPLQYSTPLEGYEVPSSQIGLEAPEHLDPDRPRWYFDKPISYVQQIVLKSAPHQTVSVEESIRSSLEPMFDVLEHVDAFRFQEGNVTLSMSDLCLRVAEVVPVDGVDVEKLLPQYNCLFLSPARLWLQDKSRFLQDDDLLGTIFKKNENVELFTSIRDLLFSVPGVSRRNFIKVGGKPILLAFTFALKTYNARFIQVLHDHLSQLYPIKIINNNQPSPSSSSSSPSSSLPSSPSSSSPSSSSPSLPKIDRLVHIHYQSGSYFVEYTPLIFAYVVLCLYLYFSVRKIEMVKSKWGLALSAMMTVVASLFMSLSLCVFVGLTPSLNGSEIFPYLVVIIGLENILVITKSVVNTPVHLEVKLRIALGLQKEGWYIFKNLITEFFILAVGFLTFVPAIQEFCLFAILGLGSDFFLQMFFFTTVLSVDIRRMELSDLQRHRSRSDPMKVDYSMVQSDRSNISGIPLSPYAAINNSCYEHSLSEQGPLATSRPMSFYSPPPTPPSFYDGYKDVFSLDSEDENIPKRVRLMHIWARYRVLQRAIMIFVVLWIVLVVCKTTMTDEDVVSPPSTDVDSTTFELPKLFRNINNISATLLSDSTAFIDSPFRPSSLLLHENLELWKQLPFNHWKNLFGFYNISLVGRYLTILPSIHLSIGHPADQEIPASEFTKLQQKLWKKLENYSTSALWHNQTSISFINKLVRYPRSTLELVLTVLLGLFSFVLLSCCLFILYKCLCSRKYARWRSSWSRRSSGYYHNHHQNYYKQIRESPPLVLIGHTQEVECVCSDGRLLASSCLGGEVRIWDSETGECITVIDRHRRVQFRPEMAVRLRSSSSSSMSHQQQHGSKISEQRSTTSSASSLDCFDLDLFCEKKTSKSRHKSVDAALANMIPDLTETIDTDFRNRARLKEADSGMASLGSSPSTGFDFTQFQLYFDEQKKLYETRERMKASRKKEKVDQKLKEINYYTRDLTPPPDTDDEFVAGSAIWCLAFKNNMVVLGCGSGDIEFWDIHSRSLVACCQQNKAGVTAICIIENRLVASRLDGTLDFFVLQYNTTHQWNHEASSYENTLQCIYTWSQRAHQMTINCLETDGVRVFTASQDNMIKVHRIEDHACLLTLIGHTGCVTTLLVDKTDKLVVSGSGDSSLRLWDIQSGSCLQKLVGHQSTITCVAYNNSVKRLFSIAMDDRLCIWDASRGHLLHCIQMDSGCCNAVAVLNKELILTGGLGCIHLWDVETGMVIRTLNLNDRMMSVFVRQLLVTETSLVVMDYGMQLRVIRFDTVLEKHE